MKKMKTRVKEFYKKNETAIIGTTITVGGVVMSVIVGDYIATKINNKAFKKFIEESVTYGEGICNTLQKDLGDMIDKGLEKSDECVNKACEALLDQGSLSALKVVKDAADKML